MDASINIDSLQRSSSSREDDRSDSEYHSIPDDSEAAAVPEIGVQSDESIKVHLRILASTLKYMFIIIYAVGVSPGCRWVEAGRE